MQKKKIFKIEDSNIEGIGTDADKKCRETAAATEKAWKKVKKDKVGFYSWRIEQFKVKKNIDAAGGTLYDDDSYIFLNGYEEKETQKIKWDVHFWIGATTTQDEYGTAAYKTVELDDFLGGDPIQHRECSGFESTLFLSYFKGPIRLLNGGAESGFNHVKPEEFTPRLLWLKGKKKVRTVEVPIELKSLNSGDVFILDAGLNIYQYQGRGAGKHEKQHGGKLSQAIDDERKGKPEKEVFSQLDPPKDETMRKFFSYFAADCKTLGGGEEIKADAPVSEALSKKMLAAIPEGQGGDDVEFESDTKKSLHQLSDASGKITFKQVAEGGKCKKDLLQSEDVFVFDVGCEVFVWIGKGASKDEKKQAMSYASKYLKDNDRPMQMPVTKIHEGGENEVFEAAFH